MAEIILDKVAGTHIESVVDATEDLKNGQWLTLGLLDDDGERRIVTKAASEEEADVLLVDAPISYGDLHFDETKYVVTAGKTGRAYHMVSGDVISVTKDVVADGVAKGDSLTIGEDGFGFKKAASGRGIAQVIGEENQGFYGDMLVIAIR